MTTKSEKKKTQDDDALMVSPYIVFKTQDYHNSTYSQDQEVKIIALRSHDFTGLGFNICGNMKEGIYIKDILHRGPAFESGKLNAGTEQRLHLEWKVF